VSKILEEDDSLLLRGRSSMGRGDGEGEEESKRKAMAWRRSVYGYGEPSGAEENIWSAWPECSYFKRRHGMACRQSYPNILKEL
jgi:hypothetical protein